MSKYREPEPVGDILPKLMRHMKPRRKEGLEAVREVWPRVVGEAVARRSRIVALERGKLTVEVASSALRQDLGVFRQEQLVESLKKELPETPISGLSCRVGTGF